MHWYIWVSACVGVRVSVCVCAYVYIYIVDIKWCCSPMTNWQTYCMPLFFSKLNLLRFPSPTPPTPFFREKMDSLASRETWASRETEWVFCLSEISEMFDCCLEFCDSASLPCTSGRHDVACLFTVLVPLWVLIEKNLRCLKLHKRGIELNLAGLEGRSLYLNWLSASILFVTFGPL